MSKVVVKNEEEIPTVVMAKAIVDIAEGTKKLLSGRLNNKALVLLLRESSGVGKREIEDVLRALETLSVMYLRPEGKSEG